MNIQELEHWFTTVELPQAPLYLETSTKVNDVNKFLESHFYALKLNPNSKINQPLLDRLFAFKLLIESNL
jgi:hypothetical protein